MSAITLSPPITCRCCGVAIISMKKYDHCPACDAPLASEPTSARESSPYDCPVCDELPTACTCLRPSVRRRIAGALRGAA